MSAWTVIAHTEVGSGGTAEITFSSIASTYDDLLILLSARGSGSGDSRLFVKFNNTLISESRNLFFTGSSALSNTYTNGDIGLAVNFSEQTANTFGSIFLYIPNYKSTVAKSISFDGVTENNATESYGSISAGRSNVTSAITSIALDPAAGNFVQYSSATLYGITKGSSGGVTVS